MWQKTSSSLRSIWQIIRDLFGKKWFVWIVIALFVTQALYLLFSVRIGVPPDELTHIRFIEFYTHQDSLSPIIKEQTDYFAIGDVTREVSYLYHYLMSLILRATGLVGLNAYVLLRFVSLVMSVLALWFGVKTARLLEVTNATIAIGLLIVTNMAQFLLMSVAVNNDNVIWLLSSLGIFLSIKLWKTKAGALSILLSLMVLIVFGIIIKKTFMPIGLVFGLGCLYYLWINRQGFKKLIAQLQLRDYTLLVLLFLGIGLVFERVGINIIQYGQIDVVCDRIHTTEECKNYGVYRRNFDLYATESSKPRDLNLVQFTGGWLYKTIARSFGVQAWPGKIETPVVFNCLVMAVLVCTGYLAAKNRKQHTWASLVWMLAIYYVVFNMFVNYSLYQRWGVFGLALQGRYIFPIIIPLVIFSVYIISYWLNSSKKLASFAPVLAGLAIISTLSISGLQLFATDDRFVADPIRPVIIFDQKDAISGFEPSV